VEEAIGSARPPDIKALPTRHPGRWVASLVVLVLIAMLIHTMVFSKLQRGNSLESRFGWHVIGQYFGSRQVLDGLVMTLELTVIAMVVGIFGGVLLAVMRLSANPLLSNASWLFIWFFRGTPVLVQLFIWYQIAWLYPTISLGIPFGPAFAHLDANRVVTAFVAASVGLGLNEAAYMSEIVRAGILSVDEGQAEAAQSLGMRRGRTMRRIVLPQAMRVIIPPTGNETISMLKTSSLASTIAVIELTEATARIYARTYQIVPMLEVACIWYLIVTSVLMIGQYYLERYFARGASRALPPTPLQRIRRMLLIRHVEPPAHIAPLASLGEAGGVR